MILSVHISKTAGNAFGEMLAAAWGERVLTDYGDWVGVNTPEALAHRAARVHQVRKKRNQLLRDYDVIHGHFIADKYLGLFPHTEFVAFFRDPYQQAVSNYEFLLRNPHIDHPGVDEFHRTRMSLADYIVWSGNIQMQFLGSVPLDSFTVVGLTEEFVRSVALFNATFGANLTVREANVNPEKPASGYGIDAHTRRLIEVHRVEDIDLYRRARELFAKQVARRDLHKPIVCGRGVLSGLKANL